jgi:hypothetical protein
LLPGLAQYASLLLFSLLASLLDPADLLDEEQSLQFAAEGPLLLLILLLASLLPGLAQCTSLLLPCLAQYASLLLFTLLASLLDPADLLDEERW